MGALPTRPGRLSGKEIMSRFFWSGLLAGLCFIALPAAAHDDAAPLEPAGDAAIEITARYSSSVLVFKVGEINLEARRSADAYSANADLGAAGLAALFTDFDIRAEVSGRMLSDQPRPDRYAHVERTGRKVRSVDIAFDSPTAVSTAEPPFGSLGQPPASDADRTGVLDPMTAVFFLSEAINGSGERLCEGSIPVFDGKQRYDLRLEAGGTERVRTRAWRGDALVCRIWYEPISGYDPEDYPRESELRHPLIVWLAPIAEGRAHLPVRLHTRAGFGGVTVEAMEIAVSAG